MGSMYWSLWKLVVKVWLLLLNEQVAARKSYGYTAYGDQHDKLSYALAASTRSSCTPRCPYITGEWSQSASCKAMQD